MLITNMLGLEARVRNETCYNATSRSLNNELLDLVQLLRFLPQLTRCSQGDSLNLGVHSWEASGSKNLWRLKPVIVSCSSRTGILTITTSSRRMSLHALGTATTLRALQEGRYAITTVVPHSSARINFLLQHVLHCAHLDLCRADNGYTVVIVGHCYGTDTSGCFNFQL